MHAPSTGQAGQTRTFAGHVRAGYRTDTDTPLKGCPVLSGGVAGPSLHPSIGGPLSAAFQAMQKFSTIGSANDCR